MIISESAILRREFAPGQTATNKSEGRPAVITADGRIQIVADAATKPHGIVSNPDGNDGAVANSADLVLLAHSGIVEVQLAANAGAITAGTTRLVLAADGRLQAGTGTASEVEVAVALETIAAPVAGARIAATLIG